MSNSLTWGKISFLIFLFVLFNGLSRAQNTSNKGTDFWVGYMAHVDGTGSNMSLYITSDVSTTGTVSVPLQGWSTAFTVTANNTTVITIPAATAYVGCSDCLEDRGIHVTSDLPIVVYSHIYHSSRSDATLVLPVPTLGKEYYAMSFTQRNSLSLTGYSGFMVIGVEDSTKVQITPTQNTLGGQLAGVPFTITINQGQVYQVQSNSDLTGSHIVTFSTSSAPCQRVGVFSGSSFCVLGCSSANSGDNLYQQLYPINAWGNNFITAPFKTRIADYFRIFAGSDTTSVSINGQTPFILNSTQYFDTLMGSANYITANKPITLAQFQRTGTCDNSSVGDPSMTILLPVEQTLDSITLYSSPFQNITNEYINIIMKSADVASFRLDGNAVSFSAVPSNSLYSYSQNTVASGNHTLTADSGFNAIAYGFGSVESYGYCAGANVRNLVQFISASSNSVSNPHVLCAGATVSFNGVVSYTPSSLKWYFGDGTTSGSQNTTHIYNNPGSYVVSLVTVRGNGSSCDIKDSTTYNLTIVGFPVAGFAFFNTCVTDTVSFIDGSTAGGGSITSWKWYFGDGDSSSLKNPSHHYASAGNYNVQLVVKSNGGCTNTITQQVSINPKPNVSAGADKDLCFGSAVTLSTTTGSGYVYQWSPANNLSCSTCSTTQASPADTQVYVIRTTLNGCSRSDTIKVNVIKPLAHINADTLSMCANGSVFIATDTISGQTYLWSPAVGLSCSTCYVTNASPSSTRQYVVTSTFRNCNAKDSVLVQVLTPDAGRDTAVCQGGSATLKASPGGSGVSYQWSPSVGLSCTTCQSPVATPASFPVTYHVSISSSICTGTDSVIISLITVNANAGTSITICPGSSAVLSASGGTGYEWSPSLGLNSTTGSSPSAAPTINTTYTVIVTDAKGCHGNDTVSVKLYAPFIINAGPDTTICTGNKIILHATGGTAYSWKPTFLLSDSSISSPFATVTDNTTYTVFITGPHNCVEEKSVTVNVFQLPFVFAGPDTIICLHQPLKLVAHGASTYQWSGPEILNCGNCDTVSVGTEGAATYTVVGTDEHACKNSNTVQLLLGTFCHFVLMPDAFSPNNDGHNDLFRPIGKGIVNVEYFVFDRWGKKVFTGRDLINGWDGKYKGELQPIDTYSWTLSAQLDDGTTINQSGNVTLIR